MSTVYFLFLLHLSVGLLIALLFVPDKAGVRFFKLCSATAAFLTTAGLGLLYRRHAFAGAGAEGLPFDRVVALTAVFVALTVVYNRAWHFDWVRGRRTWLAASVAAGLTASFFSSPGPVFTLADTTSAVLLGAAASAMILGHYYLVVLDLPIAALRRLTVLLIAALAVRAVVVGLVMGGPVHAGYQEAGLVAHGSWSADGVFVWMRLLFGIAGPQSLSWFIWKTVEIRSTQSATGILYVQLFLVLAGELLAKYLRVAAGYPL